jgi:hypothetical protein
MHGLVHDVIVFDKTTLTATMFSIITSKFT